LTLRLDAEAGVDPDRMSVDTCRRLRAYLARHGLGNVALIRDPSVPQPEPPSEKKVMRTFDD
jgi:hypothetical protein